MDELGKLSAFIGFCIVVTVTFLLCMIPWGDIAHNTTCKVGHYETVHVEAYWLNQVIYTDISNGQFIMVPQYIPAHDERVWVCDHKKGAKK